MRKAWIMLVSAIFLFSLAGCQGDNNALDNEDGRVKTNRARTNNANEGSQNNKRMRVANRASENVERMDEVEQAHVIITNNNAYVAVRLAHDDTNRGGNDDRGGNRGGGNNGGNDTMEGADNPFIENGIIDGKGDAGKNNNRNENSNGHGTDNANGNGTGASYGVGNGTNTGAAPGGGGTNDNGNGTNGGNGTNKGAAPGGNGNDYTSVNTALEQKIADQVRAADDKVHRVYVSLNEDDYNRLQNYADDIRAGRNTDGLLEDFNNAVRTMFER
ncbi:YhcN/YlaJ family sporulation lipoprotein [Bacillus sp. T33-2]|uniref:YhcN/YlaJ family sporulation lipoprotein n=1 Tax=Bacillus sp. T33-2 TaxID=2054168 RepID=UPI0015E0D663|nr:YhcN/YlaJ family sporulation lipoprotein [Bacillus sp. T33-2]